MFVYGGNIVDESSICQALDMVLQCFESSNEVAHVGFEN